MNERATLSGERTMTATESPRTIQTLHVKKDVLIAAPIDVVFETLLESAGPTANMNLKLERGPAADGFATSGTTPVICGGTCRSSSRQSCWRFAGR